METILMLGLLVAAGVVAWRFGRRWAQHALGRLFSRGALNWPPRRRGLSAEVLERLIGGLILADARTTPLKARRLLPVVRVECSPRDMAEMLSVGNHALAVHDIVTYVRRQATRRGIEVPAGFRLE